MAFSDTQNTLSKGSVDMHIGPMCNAENYLVLEHRMLEVDPRPVLTPQSRPSSFSESSPQETKTRSFIEMARNVVHKLDDVLRAPFHHFSSKKMAERSGLNSHGKQSLEFSVQQDATPPPKVFTSNHPECQKKGSIGIHKVRISHVEVKTDEKFPVIKNCHDSSLIKFCEDVRDSTKGGSAKVPRMTLFQKVRKIFAKLPSRLIEREVIDSACTARKSKRRVTFRQEDSVIYMDGYRERQRNGFSTPSDARNGSRERTSMRDRTCGLRILRSMR